MHVSGETGFTNWGLLYSSVGRCSAQSPVQLHVYQCQVSKETLYHAFDLLTLIAMVQWLAGYLHPNLDSHPQAA